MRYYIIGTSGSGKSTLAQLISKKLEIPHFDLDQLYFSPGWRCSEDDDFVQQVDVMTRGKSWAVCGNYSVVQGMLMERTDFIVWLDYPFWKIFWQVSKRTFRRLYSKESCCNGNYETYYRQFFTKDSIFWWVISSYPKRKKRYNMIITQGAYTGKWVHISCPKDLENFLSMLV